MGSARRAPRCCALAIATLACALMTLSSANVASAKGDPLPSPVATVISNGHVWVLNSENDSGSLTELNESDGSLIRVLNAKADGFDSPVAMTISGSHVWITNSRSEFNSSYGSVIELNESDG